MIIFSLEALADDSHRRHFIKDSFSNHSIRGSCFVKDWKAYYDACNGGRPVEPVVLLIYNLCVKEGEQIEIWTEREETQRTQTEKWIEKNLFPWKQGDVPKLKMRPIGDNSPAHELKERWLKELWPKLDPVAEEGKEYKRTDVDFVFESDPESIQMFRNHGIFTFDCNLGNQ